MPPMVRIAIQQRTFEARGESLPWHKKFDLQVLHVLAMAAMERATLTQKQDKKPDGPLKTPKSRPW